MTIKIRQRDESDCGAACLASILAYNKRTLSIVQIRQLSGTNQQGTSVWGIVEAAEKLGFFAKGVTGTDESLDKIPLPAIAHIMKDSPKGILHHFVVIYSVSASYVRVMDPEYGDIVKFSRSEFLSLWKQKVLVLLVPGQDFQNTRYTTNQKSSMIHILGMIQPHSKVIFACILGALFYTLLGLSTSIFIEKITDHVFPSGNLNLLNLMGVLMIIFLLFQQLLNSLQSLLVLKIGQFVDTQLILGYVRHLLRLPAGFLDSMKSGELLSRVNDAIKIRFFINEILIKSITNALITLFSFIIMFFYSWELALIMFPIIPIYIFGYYLVNKVNKKNERHLIEKSAIFEAQLIENITSAIVIKNLNHYIEGKTEEKFLGLLDAMYTSGKATIGALAFSETTNKLFTIILLWIGSYYVLDHSITPGELMSFYSIVGYFALPLSSLLSSNKAIQNALIAGDRLFEIMHLEEEDKGLKESQLQEFKQLNVSQVSFRYDQSEKLVLDQLSFSLSRGETIAFIGESGCGKSTIINLIMGLYMPESGSITLNGVDLSDISRSNIRNIFSLVPQDSKLLSGSILDNITSGDHTFDIEAIYGLLKDVGLEDLIQTLPQGIHTPIGELGSKLSGGERQKIAIARALYRNTDVLILDEPTSSLDVFSEEQITQLLTSLKAKGLTTILISHRLNSVNQADRIYVLEQGAILEEGQHFDLIESKGKYYKMATGK